MLRPCKHVALPRQFPKLWCYKSRVRWSSSTVNPVGIHHLEEPYRSVVFGERTQVTNRELIEVSMKHLELNKLLGKPTIKPRGLGEFDIPPLLGTTLDEHFQKIGRHMSEPYLTWCREYIDSTGHPDSEDVSVPPIPSKERWIKQSGWTRYTSQSATQVEFPPEKTLTFDVETLYKLNDYAVVATAVSNDAWYCWISPWLLGETHDEKQLIPMGPHQQVIIGHNVGYDRKRVKEEYSLQGTDKFFLDTMSLHVATSGMCSQQRPHWLKRSKALRAQENTLPETAAEASGAATAIDVDLAENPWLNAAAMNSLSSVYEYIYGSKVDKAVRKDLADMSRGDALESLPEIVDYCAKDVFYTKRIFNRLLPSFLTLCPHPVSFGALKPMSSLFLPISRAWERFIESAEASYNNALDGILSNLQRMAQEKSELVNDPKALEAALKDPWLSQLDWTVSPIRMKKGKKGQADIPAKNQKLPGKPNWYKALFPSASSPMNLTARTRITPLLLRLKWDGHPLIWYDEYGWSFKVPKSKQKHYEDLNYRLAKVLPGGKSALFRIHHKDGGDARCVSPMAKSYLQFFENGVLSSDSELAMATIKANSECSYWLAVRERVQSQMPVFQDTVKMGYQSDSEHFGMIIPRLIPMGTVTRRAVEDTWLTASNAKKTRIGSELKSLVQAPEGYKFVGADVDSEELWIASLMGDALFGIHGGTALGWMTLEGTKKDGTDLHSRTASIMGISRDQAKIFNYGRIYGAGLKYAVRLLKQFNPGLSESEAQGIATRLYEATKGTATNSRVFDHKRYWRGGSESMVFNQLELMACQEHQRSPVLGAGITTALLQGNLNSKTKSFLTSRVNWSIQSSGVDYLHLLIASMHYLCSVYHIEARLFLTVHDEIRYMVRDADVMRASLALQIANLWTRSMFCQQMGMDDVPHSVAFFSLIDVDKVLRKEVNLDCVTPSNPHPIAEGMAVDIYELLDQIDTLGDPDILVRGEFLAQSYVPRTPVLHQIKQERHFVQYVKAQVAPDKESVRIIENTALSRGLYDDGENSVTHISKMEEDPMCLGPVINPARKKATRVSKTKPATRSVEGKAVSARSRRKGSELTPPPMESETMNAPQSEPLNDSFSALDQEPVAKSPDGPPRAYQ